MIPIDALVPLLPAHLSAQRWLGHEGGVDAVVVVEAEVWADAEPRLWWLLVDATAGGEPAGRYQLLLGARAPADHDFLHGKDAAVLGEVEIAGDSLVVYDATIDAELALALLHRVAPEVPASSVRPLTVEQSNTSIVFDEHVIVKVFRHLHAGPNRDVEVVSSLHDVGFGHLPDQLGVLAHDGADLAVARAFLTGATDGWHLALTSLRVLFHDHLAAAASGGDFGPDAARLGSLTAELHLALAAAGGVESVDPTAWLPDLRAQLDRAAVHVPFDAIAGRYDELADLGVAVPAIRIHGDLHLGQVLRADAGWFVIDFEGEPARPVAERDVPASPLRDVAGMLRSFHYAAEVAQRERAEEEPDESLAEHAADWERRARTRFLDAYRAVSGIEALLPDEPVAGAVLRALELDKAVYEVAYEVANRPTWRDIPLGAIHRLLA